jgi:hypothetical protein
MSQSMDILLIIVLIYKENCFDNLEDCCYHDDKCQIILFKKRIPSQKVYQSIFF